MKSLPHLRLSAYVAAAALIGFASSPIHAADRFWIAPNGGQFGATAFWSTTAGGPGGASVPGPADTANFTLDETYEVAFLADATNFMLDVEDGDVTFDLRGRTYTVASNQAQSIDVGLRDGQTARLTVQGGTLAVDTNGKQVVIGASDGGPGSSIGFLTITSGGHLGNATARPDILVGRSGAGTLTVNENGRIDGRTFIVGSFGGNNGTVTITGPSAVADISGNTTIGLGDSIFAGGAVAGTVNVTNGGTLTSAASVLIGDNLGAHGSVSVSGAGSSWIIAGISTIGEDGDGTLTITSGGLVSSAAAVTLGNTSTGFGTATVTGAGSRWNLSSNHTIGASGLGVMTISNGGQVTSNSNAVLGSVAVSEGRVTVTGAGSQWTLANPLTVGDSGKGELTVSAGGEVSTSFVFLGNTVAASAGVATITGAGSKLTTTGNVTVANIGDGTLNVAGGAEVYVGGILNVNDPAGGPSGTLNLDGGSIFVASNFTNNGKFDFTDGLLQVARNFQPSAAAAAFSINGADTGDLPTLDLIGSGGLLNLASITVGDNRRGKMLVRQGRVVDLGSNGVNIGAFAGSEGLLSVQSGASLSTTGSVAVGGNGGTAGGTGTLEISGGTVDVNTLRLFRDGTINLNGGTLAINTLPVLDGQLNWTAGTLRFDAPFSLTSTNVPKLLGSDATIRAGQVLASNPGVAVTLQTPIVVDGGMLSASSLVNQARIEIKSGSIGAVQNNGLIVGDGTIDGAVTNGAAGTIRVDAGEAIFFTGAVAPNAGELNLVGGTLDFTSAVTNSASGRISGRGTLDFNGGLTNAGKLQFSGGPTDIFGNVTFTGGAGGGEMINSGGGNVVTFYDNVTHNGDEIRTSPTNTTVFFGNFTGAGPFTGTGAVRFEGTFSPGNSPGQVAMDGDVELSAGAQLLMELSGVRDDLHDQLQVGGELLLGGSLEVTLLDGFEPRYGDAFDLFDYGALSGRFDTLDLPMLGAGLIWDTSALYSTGAIIAVPEPAGWILLVGVIVAACLIAVRPWQSATIRKRLALSLQAR